MPRGRPKAKNRKCSVADCENEFFATGLCRLHYRRKARGTGPIDAPLRLRGLDQVQFSLRLPREYHEAYHALADEAESTIYEICRKILMDWQDRRAEAVASGNPLPPMDFPRVPRKKA